MKHISKEEYDRLSALLEERQLLKAHHANTPIGCYSLKQKLLILADRKEAIQHLTQQIETIMGAE